MTKPDPNLVLVLKYSADHGFGGWHGHLTAVICYSNDGPIARSIHDPGAILSPNWTGSNGLYQDYADLTVTGSLSRDFDGWLNWEFEYRNVYAVGPRRWPRPCGASTRRWAHWPTSGEPPPTSPPYLARFAEVIGCHRYAERSDTMLPTGSHWRHMAVDGMRQWAARAEKQFRTQSGGNP